MPGAQVAREMRRDLHSDRSASFSDLARHVFHVVNFADDAEGLGINETVEEPAALHGAIFVQNRHRHMFHVVVERITKRNHLNERREKHKEQRHWVAQNRDEFLEEDRVQAAEGDAFHGIAPTRASAREAPNPKHQAPKKLQIPNRSESSLGDLELGAWCFSGAWSLGFGIFT